MLTTPVMDHIGLSKISEETTKDETLHKLRSIIMKGQTWIPKSADKKLLTNSSHHHCHEQRSITNG